MHQALSQSGNTMHGIKLPHPYATHFQNYYYAKFLQTTNVVQTHEATQLSAQVPLAIKYIILHRKITIQYFQSTHWIGTRNVIQGGEQILVNLVLQVHVLSNWLQQMESLAYRFSSCTASHLWWVLPNIHIFIWEATYAVQRAQPTVFSTVALQQSQLPFKKAEGW